MSFLAVLKACHNHPTLNSNNNNNNNNQQQQQEQFIPFYLHLPDQQELIKPIRLPPPPPPPKRLTNRSLSSSSSTSNSAERTKLRPLASYLTRSNSSDQLDNHPFNEPIYQPPWDQAISNRDSRQPIGFLRPAILKALIQDNQHMNRIHSQACWKLFYPIEADEQEDLMADRWPVKVSFEDWINQAEDRIETRQEHLDRLIRGWKQNGLFLDQLSGQSPSIPPPQSIKSLSPSHLRVPVGWRNEEYAVYGPKDHDPEESDQESTQLPGSNLAFRIERAAVGLFGFLSFGVHLTGMLHTYISIIFIHHLIDPSLSLSLSLSLSRIAYVKKDGQYFFWIPRRSATKAT
jgi:hypothetical protein